MLSQLPHPATTTQHDNETGTYDVACALTPPSKHPSRQRATSLRPCHPPNALSLEIRTTLNSSDRANTIGQIAATTQNMQRSNTAPASPTTSPKVAFPNLSNKFILRISLPKTNPAYTTMSTNTPIFTNQNITRQQHHRQLATCGTSPIWPRPPRDPFDHYRRHPAKSFLQM